MDIRQKKAVILGLGQSVLNYRRMPDDVCFGVNDIARYHDVDYTVVVDGKSKFEKDRLKFIENTKSILVSHLPEWIKGVRMFELIIIKGFSVQNMDSGVICFSNNSPFVALIYAYQKGFRKFDLYGVDVAGHKSLDTQMNRTQLITDYKRLIKYLESKGCEVNIKCKLKQLL